MVSAAAVTSSTSARIVAVSPRVSVQMNRPISTGSVSIGLLLSAARIRARVNASATSDDP
jgi:hypothetical protein